MLVVMGAVAVLGLGAFAFIGGNAGPGASPTPTSGARVSPLPSITASPVPTSSPTVSASPTPSPSPEPTPFQPTVQEGPGFVTFGSEADGSLRIIDPRATFELGERIVVSAELLEPADPSEISVDVYKFDPASLTEELVRQFDVRARVDSAQRLLRRLRTNRLDGPGFYLVRYVRGEQVLAEGSFEVR